MICLVNFVGSNDLKTNHKVRFTQIDVLDLTENTYIA